MKCDKKIRNRLSRCEGQLRGISSMMEEEKDCKEIVSQLSAVRSSIDRLIAVIVVENLRSAQNIQDMDDEKVQQAIDLLVKSR